MKKLVLNYKYLAITLFIANALLYGYLVKDYIALKQYAHFCQSLAGGL